MIDMLRASWAIIDLFSDLDMFEWLLTDFGFMIMALF